MGIRAAGKRLLPASAYHWLSGRYQAWRRLYAYPPGANVRHADYDAYWNEKAKGQWGHLSAFRLRRAAVFARVLQPGDRVLDVGTGDGAILNYLISTRHIAAKGIDVSPAAVAFCRQSGLDVDLVDFAKPFEALPDGTWDYVILSEVLEHLAHPEAVLDALQPRVRRAFLVSVPNSGFIAHRLRLALGRFPLQWIVFPGEHLRFWTVADFDWWTTQLGFTIAARYPYEGIRGLMNWWPTLFAAGIVYLIESSRSEPSGT